MFVGKSGNEDLHARIAALEAEVERTKQGLTAALVVIDYAASILWNCRPTAIAARPSHIDQALRNARAALEPKP
ncbi:hypothetical protein [Alteraurantiacibacter buctensis]|uniref:Uncharacterized protein n=1 Tax=Alteraurantiacibacter buctensis TaxID=1503981 RepID=A0A844YX19_9SPHN|nr:hypothetical protein [Alteraurantiacibacter buctensis]MXO72895.1 hypothetical protein [Alteraurantiacibacter buctensis]